ncbi:23S rRNA (uracil(747)-C(5))-methyltransferase RlmC [Marinobacterium sp. D7]|uniref:23S rRNA (uracil(747)-C(5))-methyltransferase RlmC n=1 Tax=Marinobacterium ramblicola TaxID=2849041 RepID=UPI001C2D283F|nr:23S rRNA (uracil(747)-C(5))-methyltransferase RlmC [Marinobacterium ramblicola]MBV1788153.1 23S rRNA (uracil(747)-C(5))-methyltransferase RlmC [Marinobacterium ramblicola]
MHCIHFTSGQCRSCDQLATPYLQQVENKQLHLQNLFGDRAVDQWLPFVVGEKQGFRNKAKMVALGAAHAPILGILGPNGEPVSLVDCPLYTEAMTEILTALPRFIQRAGIPPYQIQKKKGELKFVLLTQSLAENSFMLRFVLRSDSAIERVQHILPELLTRFPAIQVVSVNIQPVHMAILEGDEEIFLTEKQHIVEVFNGIPLAIRPKSFFQTNPKLAAQLYKTAATWVTNTRAKRIWDLFCGVGGFGLHCLQEGVNLMGIEIEPEAIRCAQASARRLGYEQSVLFSAFDATALQATSTQFPELIIMNPPRRGVGAELCSLINASRVPNLIYSSCNAQTLIGDLDCLDNYKAVCVQGFDLFPHTQHYEVLVHLQRKQAA